jgi:DNA-binding beta-propeller fold protein YncE
MRTLRRRFCLFAPLLLLIAFAAPAPSAGAHSLLFSVSELPSEHPPLREFLEDPCGVAVGSAGQLYVSDYYHDAINSASSSGALGGKLIKAVEPLDGPCGLALDPAGDLFANNYHRNVVEFSPGFSAAGVIDSEHPTGLAVDQATGNLFVDDRTYVAEYEAPVYPGEAPIKIGEGSLGDGYGLAVSGFPATAGDLYVADAATDTVKAFDPAAAEPDEPIAVIDGHGTPEGGFVSLRDSALAVDDSNGHLYVLDDLQPLFTEHPEAALDEFDPEGAYQGRLPKAPTLIDSGPSGVAVDNSGGPGEGNVYVTSGNGEKASLNGYGPSSGAAAIQAPLAPGAPGAGGAGSSFVLAPPPGPAATPLTGAQAQRRRHHKLEHRKAHRRTAKGGRR